MQLIIIYKTDSLTLPGGGGKWVDFFVCSLVIQLENCKHLGRGNEPS